MSERNAIGVFDSGIGGLTVLQALRRACPYEDYIYLGDMARLPYGTKSPATIERYAEQAAQQLVDRGVKCLVVACNTAATIALTRLQSLFPDIPIIGVVEPSAQAAVNNSSSKHIAVIATEATVNAKGYQSAIHRIDPGIDVQAQSAGLLVALAEEGWVTGPIVEGILQHYLEPLLTDSKTDCLVLGCTHFPVLVPSIQRVVPPHVHVVDSATATAVRVKEVLTERQLTASTEQPGAVQYLVTDCPERFIRVAAYFLNQPLTLDLVVTIDSQLVR